MPWPECSQGIGDRGGSGLLDDSGYRLCNGDRLVRAFAFDYLVHRQLNSARQLLDGDQGCAHPDSRSHGYRRREADLVVSVVEAVCEPVERHELVRELWSERKARGGKFGGFRERLSTMVEVDAGFNYT